MPRFARVAGIEEPYLKASQYSGTGLFKQLEADSTFTHREGLHGCASNLPRTSALFCGMQPAKSRQGRKATDKQLDLRDAAVCLAIAWKK